MTTSLWVSFGPGGVAQRPWYLPDNGTITTQQHRAAGRTPVNIPQGYPVGELRGMTRDANGVIEFDWPPHLRDWRSLRTKLSQSPKFAAVMIAAEADSRLAMALQSFNSALSNLVNDGATETEWRSLSFTWSRFKPALEAAGNAIPDGVVADIEASANGLKIQLVAPPPEVPPPPPPSNP
ncbi:MAG: hypothetical protein AAF889_08000 [Cyanobacteria bacterium P01_D01_bin.73]